MQCSSVHKRNFQNAEMVLSETNLSQDGHPLIQKTSACEEISVQLGVNEGCFGVEAANPRTSQFMKRKQFLKKFLPQTASNMRAQILPTHLSHKVSPSLNKKSSLTSFSLS